VALSAIKFSTIDNVVFPLPPLAEQRRIVAKIEELMPLVERYGKAQQALDQLNESLPARLRQSILQEAIQGRLVPQDPKEEPASELLKRIRKEKEQLVKEGKLKKKDLESKPIEEDEIPFEIPESWKWVRLKEVISLLSGQDLEPQRYSSNQQGIPYITGASCFKKGSLILNRWTTSPTSVSHKGDLLITCKGTVGTMAFNTIGDIHIARQIMAISSFGMYMPYLQYFMEFIVPDLEKKAHSIIPGISREDVLNCLVPLPPLSEQKRIVAKVEELFGVMKV
jgi:type I restriction enzyme S subunit